ncbi:larval cuticle protein 9-like [Musca domestica]|uniref:Larval cuticle protein 9 n=1 Tax=Musca domestica TaxID=7370 RepID=A0A1I8MCH9_MUSDO|nr:larval cuticle protein 9 [Musca domestica]XP_058983539.1 larval cuticle protein 9-like [Musca domestica]
MKFTIVLLACLFAVAFANEEADVVKEFREVNKEDFKYGYELTNKIRAFQEGHLEDEKTWIVKGEYEFVTKDGKHVKVTYTADDYGYHPKVEHSE